MQSLSDQSPCSWPASFFVQLLFNVERQPEELGEHRQPCRATKPSDDEPPKPADLCSRNRANHAIARLAEPLAEPMVRDRLRQAPVDHPVLEPAGDEARHPQQHAGERGEEDRARAERVERLRSWPSRSRRRGTVCRVRASRQNRTRARSTITADDVADRGGELRARDARDQRDELVEPVPAPARSRIVPASAAAVIDGCFVASVKPSSCITRKLPA